jgi:hypothetical protein
MSAIRDDKQHVQLTRDAEKNRKNQNGTRKEEDEEKEEKGSEISLDSNQLVGNWQLVETFIGIFIHTRLILCPNP